MSEEIEPYFRKNVIIMHLFAQYRPENDWPLVIKALYYSWRAFIFFCFSSTLIFSYIDIQVNKFEQISDVAMNILNLFVYSSIFLRNPYFMWHYERVEYLIKRLNIVMKESGTFAFEKFSMKRGRVVSDVIMIVWTLFVLSCGVVLAISPLFKSDRELPLPMWLFYDWTTNANYTFTLILQAFAQVFMVCCFANIEMFNICFHILMGYQFELLGEDFKYLIPNVLHKCGMSQKDVEEYIKNPDGKKFVVKVDEISATTEFQTGVLDNLRICIAHHAALSTLKDEFYEFISPLLAVELNFLFAYMIFVLFTIVTTDNTALYPALIQYFFAIVAQVFVIMVAGESLTAQIEELRTTLFNIPWYLCDRKFLLDFKFAQMRMTRNEYLKAGKLLPISRETCLEFLKKAASFFAFLRQVNDE